MGEFDFTGELEKLDDWKMPEMRGGAPPRKLIAAVEGVSHGRCIPEG